MLWGHPAAIDEEAEFRRSAGPRGRRIAIAAPESDEPEKERSHGDDASRARQRA